MAGEVGHVVYGARLLYFLKDEVEDPIYWAGTLFPDIRHFGIVSRKRTHFSDVTLQTLVAKNNFLTGMRVHAWIDATRERFLREQHIKETLPWHPFVPHALKLVEDEMLYDSFDDWNLVHRVLNQVYDEELEYITEREPVQRWHTILQTYFKHKPNDASRKQLSLDIGLSDASANEVNSVVQKLKDDKKTEKLVSRFLQHLEDILR